MSGAKLMAEKPSFWQKFKKSAISCFWPTFGQS